ncbi:MAG TPA: isoprenyl transferase [Spirochaetota bacterium]
MFFRKFRIDTHKIPAHVAVIMDGNGRWAQKHNLPRVEGHRKGADVIEKLTDAATEIGIKVVSIYAFSTENWSRPKAEVSALWKILDRFYAEKMEVLSQKGVRVVHSGSMNRLPSSVRAIIESAEMKTRKNKKIILNLCLNYGGRQEIVDAVNEWVKNRSKNEKVSASKIRKYFYQPDLPDVDLLIRTSGESRISNFLLWQCAYAEFVFTDVLWPDFSRDDVYKAVSEYQNRQRRFGGL